MLLLSQSCPKIEVESKNFSCDSISEFVVHIKDSRPTDKPSYKWSVSAGRIVSGQGMPSIKFDSTGLVGHPATITVEVDGLAPGCDNSESITVSVSCDPPISNRYDQYGELTFKEEKSRLDMFAYDLQQMPEAKGYIISYNKSSKRAQRTRDYLVNKHNIEFDRIVILEGGERKDLLIELYIMPVGADPPSANPPRRRTTH